MTGRLRRATPSAQQDTENGTCRRRTTEAGGWELRWVHRDLQRLRMYRIKYTEWAISISRTAQQADKDPLRIDDANSL